MTRIPLARSGPLAALLVTALFASAVPAAVPTALPAAVAATADGAHSFQPRVDGGPNPLAGHKWGVYEDPRDTTWQAYENSSGTKHRLIGKVALQPRVRWFGDFNKYAGLYKTVRRYIQYSQLGNRDAIVQFAVFRMVPWESGACTGLPDAAAQTSYKRWVDRFATAVGLTRAVIVLQPDLPLALCSPHHSMIPLNLVSYAAKRFSRLKNTTTYLDAGAADWETVPHAAWLLSHAGVGYTRGFALNVSHSDSTANQIRFGTEVRQALAAGGYRGTHFIVNTAANGKPFTHTYYRQHYRARYGNSAPACQTRSQTKCVTLGIPPTADVANTRWGLSSSVRSLARKYCDGYLWIGRSWLDHGLDVQRMLDVARTTPF